MRSATIDTPRASWERLRDTVKSYDSALFLGAGVSFPNRIPTWKKFVAGLGVWSRKELASLSSSDLSLISLCEIAKRRSPQAWKERVRQTIYKDFVAQVGVECKKIPGLVLSDFGSKGPCERDRASRFFQATNPVLWELVRICGRQLPATSGEYEKNDRFGAVLSTNLDSLPQLCDRAIHGSPRMLRTVERASTETDAEKIPLYQLHGYLLPPGVDRRMSGEAADGLILTEAEYVVRTDDPYSWANVTLHWAVREFPVVFVGCSMADDLIRRALHRSCRERIQDYSAKNAGKPVKESVQRRHFAVIQWDEKKPVVNRLKNESAATLGVWPLWVKNYDTDLPDRVKQAVRDV